MTEDSLEKFQSLQTTPLTFTTTTGGGTTSTKKKKEISLYSDLNSDKSILVFGLSSDVILPIDPNQLSLESLTISNSYVRRHNGLSCIRFSKINPQLCYSSSNTEGSIFSWDLRTEDRKPAQKFSTKVASIGSTVKPMKPILNFDVSANDEVICGGTELDSSEDSYLIFWDARSTNLLGGYSDSHSDDITAIRFHPSNTHSLATGSSDGLMNVFDLLQSTEDDALIYSFNTISSVDAISWKKQTSPIGKSSPLVCLTHTNEIKIWDSISGDPITEFSRQRIAESMKNTNPEPDTIHLCGFFDTNDGKLEVLISTSGNNPQLLELSDDDKLLCSKSIFLNQNSVFQTAQYVSKTNQWITCDDKGIVQVWSSNLSDGFANLDMKSSTNVSKKKHTTARFKPYSKD